MEKSVRKTPLKKPWHHINKKMLSSKFAYFFEYAKEGSHWPYLVLFYVSIGLDPAQAGFISGLRFIGGVLGAPICGWIADKTGQHRTIAILVCFMAAITNIMQPIVTMLMGNPEKNTCPQLSAGNDSNLYASYKVASYHQPDDAPTAQSSGMFYFLLAASTVASFFDGTTMGFVDSGVLRNMLASPTPTDIGKQRYFGPPGVGISAFLSGVVVDHFPRLPISCYTGIFVNYSVACTGMAITFFFLLRGVPQQDQEPQQQREQAQEQKSQNVNSDINHILITHMKKLKTWLFLFVVFFNGMALALAFSFSFLFLKDMNASNAVMGLAMCMNGFTGAIFFVISQRLIHILGGSLNAMAFSCLCWVVRYLCLAYMTQPYHFLLICMLNGLTCSLFVSAYVDYIKNTFPPKIFTVICGIASSLYNSGGYLIANIIGGIGYKYMGAQKLFVACSIACGCCSVATFVYRLVLLRVDGKEEGGPSTDSSTGTEMKTTTSQDNNGFTYT